MRKVAGMTANLGLDFWLTQWNLDPSILIGTALIVGGYFLCHWAGA
jgi:hypothetical protein